MLNVDGINGMTEGNFDRKNMKADEGDFLDRINKINTILGIRFCHPELVEGSVQKVAVALRATVQPVAAVGACPERSRRNRRSRA
jgi:hypothetical protein